MDFKNTFRLLGQKLNDYASELGAYGIDGNLFLEISKQCELIDNIWHYPTRPILIIMPHTCIPNHTVPKLLRDCESSLEIRLSLTGDIKIKSDRSMVDDPMHQIDGFDIVVSTDKYISSWHLDRHIMAEGEAEGTYVHPIYHFTHGGFEMEGPYESSNSEDYYGNAIIMRNPRLMHPPMDLILGLDFVFNQFMPRNTLSILKDPVYMDLIEQVKGFLWQPFALALAKNYCKNISVNGTNLSFNDRFVKSTVNSLPN